MDTDYLIENAIKMPCRQIFRDQGEKKFRALEKEQIATLKDCRNRIIATGGGTLADPDNAAMLKNIGCLVYIKISLGVLWKRMQSRELPAYLDTEHPENSFYHLAKKRIPAYEAAAQCIIEADHLAEEEIVSAIITHRNQIYGQ